MDRADRHALWGDMVCALSLAGVMTFGWAWRDWADLSALRLPDTDDVMRLQQIRDWLGGQAFSDLSQHRLGTGLAMHWSRLPDLVPGGMIALLRPWLGEHHAQLVAVIAWPAMLFGAALALVGWIARSLGGAPVARTAIVVAAIAYPTTTIFLPGRIDHHGLQVVLLLVIARSLVAAPGMASGLVAGLAAAASLVIGMETVPLIAAAGVAMTVEWIGAGSRSDDRMMGFGIGLGAGLLAASIVFRTDQWNYPACDGFTATLFRGAIAAAFAPMLIVLAARGVDRPIPRAMLAAGVGLAIAGGVAGIAPACLSPYGAVDPLLARLWLAHVGEAQSVATAPAATVIGYLGVMAAGIVAGAWRCHVTRDRRLYALLALQVAALALACWQLRGAYAGAILAAPALAEVIAAARRRGSPWLAAAWLGSAGMLYPLAADALTEAPSPATRGKPGQDCRSASAVEALARLPHGRLIAPLDLGADAIAATGLSVVGAPYHRNNAGNLATYRFFLGGDRQAARIVRDWRIDYVALCDNGFGGFASDDIAGRLTAGDPPPWLKRRGHIDGLTLYRVEPRLLDAVATR